jgi:hypothetical protein
LASDLYPTTLLPPCSWVTGVPHHPAY